MKMTSDQLKAMGLAQNPDGTYSKQKEERVEQKKVNEYYPQSEVQPKKGYRTITIKLFGVPMPKQSVRQGNNGVFYQPKEMKDKVADYQRQIKMQLPPDWKPFNNMVHVRKCHFVFPPLKGFSADMMRQLEMGKSIWKPTKPDVIDNLKKLPFDSMSKLVYKDDSIIVSEDGIRKVYGLGGMILIELEGF